MTLSRKISISLILLDVASVVACFNISAHLRDLPATAEYARPILFLPLPLLVLFLYLIDAYKPRTDMMSLDYTSHHVIAHLVAMTGTLLATFVVIKDFPLQSSRGIIIFGFIALAPITLTYRRFLYQRFIVKQQQRSIIFIGDIAGCQAFREEFRRNHMGQPLILCDTNATSLSSALDDGTAIRSTSEILSLLASEGEHKVEAIVLREGNRELPLDLSRRLVQYYFSGIPTYTLELFHQVYWRKIPLYRINQTWLFQEGFEIAREPVFERIKRITDIVLALIGCIIFAPFIATGALAVWLEDRGPVFFTQMRVGKNHSLFRLHKLRSMRVGSSTGDPYTRQGDSRVTRVGKILRATRIDELPQIWNVLKGDMSLIGPRAEWDRLVANYEKQIPCYDFRHLVKPGITGWAQVNYPYGANVEDTLRKLEYDLYYIRHFSFLLDAAIVLKTLHVMIFGKGR
jgi:exopolysaccharide biosynthesis polyprenyl glycosylphosphotransferase